MGALAYNNTRLGIGVAHNRCDIRTTFHLILDDGVIVSGIWLLVVRRHAVR